MSSEDSHLESDAHMLHRFHKGGHCGNLNNLASHQNKDTIPAKLMRKIPVKNPLSSNQLRSRSISPDKPSTSVLIHCLTGAEESQSAKHQQAHIRAIKEGIAGGKPFCSKASLVPSQIGLFESPYPRKSNLF